MGCTQRPLYFVCFSYKHERYFASNRCDVEKHYFALQLQQIKTLLFFD